MVSDVVNRTGTFDPLAVPDERGRFGKFGGQYAPETLMPALDELIDAWRDADRTAREETVRRFRPACGS